MPDTVERTARLERQVRAIDERAQRRGVLYLAGLVILVGLVAVGFLAWRVLNSVQESVSASLRSQEIARQALDRAEDRQKRAECRQAVEDEFFLAIGQRISASDPAQVLLGVAAGRAAAADLANLTALCGGLSASPLPEPPPATAPPPTSTP